MYLETGSIQEPPSRGKNQTVSLKVSVIILAYQQLTRSLSPWGKNILLHVLLLLVGVCCCD